MSKLKLYHHFFIPMLLLFSVPHQARAQPPGTIKFHFIHTAGGKLVQADSAYITPLSETYSLRKLKYYISNIGFDDVKQAENVYLVNAFEENSFTLVVTPGKLHHIKFMLGVDSANNCSGAQSGALDPMNDMFWTWNSGYVMFKMEGESPQSTADLNRIEHHIGGYKGLHKTMRIVKLSLPQPIIIREGQQQDIVIAVDLDKYFRGVHEIRIKEDALLMTSGEKASKFADNFPGMFYLKGFTQ